MRRNIIKVTDEIKEGGRNEDTEEFLLFSHLESKALGVNKLRNGREKIQITSFLVHRKLL